MTTNATGQSMSSVPHFRVPVVDIVAARLAAKVCDVVVTFNLIIVVCYATNNAQ